MSTVDEAFDAIPRINFLRPKNKAQHQADTPLPIGYGQTNSQPSTVRQMLRWLDPQPRDSVLDVGSGSGWTTALLAHMVQPEGEVYAVEKIPKLVQFGKENCERIGVSNVHFFQAHDTPGLPNFAPYDRILVSAAAPEVPLSLLNQLAVDGRIVIPIKNSILVIDKLHANDYKTTEYPGYVFVPLL